MARKQEALIVTGFSTKEAERIYKLYPRQVARPIAIDAILRALVRLSQRKGEAKVADPVAWLIEQTEGYARAVEGRDRHYLPHPSTWYNQDRFDDGEEEWGSWRTSVKPGPGGTDNGAPALYTPDERRRQTMRQEMKDTF